MPAMPLTPVLAAAGYNFHLLLKWLELLLSTFLAGSESSGRPSMGLKIENFTDDLPHGSTTTRRTTSPALSTTGNSLGNARAARLRFSP